MYVILEPAGLRIWVHRNECQFDMADAAPFDLVDIKTITDTPRGPVGQKCVWLERPETPTFVGTVVVLIGRPRAVGFIRPDNAVVDPLAKKSPDDVMFAVVSLVDVSTFDSLAVGDRLRGAYVVSDDGRRRALRASVERL
jgi:hypothetical protein